MRESETLLVATLLAFVGAVASMILLIAAIPAEAQLLPPVPAPPGNPLTEPKRVLGKILFWDEQLSSDDDVACGTCHIPSTGGADPQPARHPGPDGVAGTADDVFGSRGVVRRDRDGNPLDDPTFGFGRQVTGRSAPSNFADLHARELFWDGRASATFRDPLDPATVLLPAGGALESQAVGPILSSVEMARDGRTWADVTDKLAGVRPLRLADSVPADAAEAIAAAPGYPELFATAFGDPEITPARIAFAIATYQRTLVPDQTPWDRFVAGDQTAMSAAEARGWNVFRGGGARCDNCHVPPFFTNGDYLNIGLRPAAEDEGRRAVSGLAEDFGDMKVAGLRNVALRDRLMHNGRITGVADAVDFYLEARGHSFFLENIDGIPPDGTPLTAIRIPPDARQDLVAFLSGALTDPRVEAEAFPFDRPRLGSEAGAGIVRCSDVARGGCMESVVPGRSRLLLRGGSRPAITWKLVKAQATAYEDFGDPLAADGSVFCLYEGEAADSLVFEGRAPADGDCGDGSCWKRVGASSNPRGWRYRSAAAEPDGVRKVLLRAGDDGAAKVTVSMRGETIARSPFGEPSLPARLPMTAQVQSASGACWSATFLDAEPNDAAQFRSR